jgi:ribosomal protein S18 acetylase RimI-like enzyme
VTAKTNPDRNRIVAFDLGLRSRVAQRVPTPSGFALRFPREPAFWDLNFLYVERPVADVDALLSEADDALSGLGHRLLVFDEPLLPERVAADLSRRGWAVETLVAMVAGRSAPPPPARALPAASEVPPPALVAPRRTASRELGLDEPSVAAVETADAALRAAVRERAFASRGPDGSIVAWARLYEDGHTGQIEDVQTLEAHQRAGHAEAVVRAALTASRGLGLTFLWADADDFPRRLYARLGFTVAARRWRMLYS